MSKVICLIQARAGSVRLPGKALMALAGQPLIAHVIARASAIAGVDETILAVPYGDAARFQGSVTIPIVEPPKDISADDVLGRLRFVANTVKADVVVRVTGDCPLLAPDIAADVLKKFHKEDADFASNDTRMSGWPDGFDVEVFSMDLLTRAANDSLLLYDREHVTPWMQRAVGVRATVWRSAVDYSGLKLSVDTREDFDRVARIVAQLEPDDLSFHATIAAAKKAGLWK